MGSSQEGIQFFVQFKDDASAEQIEELLVSKYHLLLPQNIHGGKRYKLAVAKSAAQEVMIKLQQENIVEHVEPLAAHDPAVN